MNRPSRDVPHSETRQSRRPAEDGDKNGVPHWSDISRLYHAALERRPDARADYLAAACAGDAALQREVESLLACQPAARPFMASPAPGIGDGDSTTGGGAPRAAGVTLAAGTHVGPYEIRALIGRGGMGEVYRATDTRLRRDVAIKVLRREGVDRGRLDRFEQEARTAAALNHPNIVVAHDVGSSDAGPYVVSELLEGENLRECVSGDAALPLRTVIDYGQQIARGLAAAHQRGIVHRDLKPENVFVTRAGQVKILDFGLAKLTQPPGVDAAANADPDGIATQPGFVLGTPGYMSPEQAVGSNADHRADIFSFGLVLYELATGMRAFHGRTRADTMAALLKDEPPAIDSIRRTSPGLSRIITRCIDKVPERRFQSAADLAFALEELSAVPDLPVKETVFAPALAPVRRRTLFIVGTSVVVLTSLFAIRFAPAYWQERRPTPETAVRRAAVVPPRGHAFGSDPASGDIPFGLSPDGGSVAFVARTGEETAVWIRPLDELDAVKVSGTEGAVGRPFWSPDGKSVAYFVPQKLKAVELATGTSRTICEIPTGRDSDGAWGAAAILIVWHSGAILCPAVGGSPSPQFLAFEAGAGVAVASPSHPQFLPDGTHIIFTARGPQVEHNGIFVSAVTGELRMRPARRLLPDESAGAYAGGRLLFIRDRLLMAQPFEWETATLSGVATPLTQSIDFEDARAARIAASASSVLYSTGTPRQSQFTWATGTDMTTSPVPAAEYEDFSLSHDGTQLAVVRREPRLRRAELWVADMATGESRPLARTPIGAAGTPVWSPDDGRIAFSRHAPGRSSVAVVPAAGGREQELLVESGDVIAMDRSPFRLNDWGGRPGSLSYQDLAGRLFVLPISPDAQPRPVDPSGAAMIAGSRFSPDGKLIAYAVLASSVHVYVEPWPATGRRWQISQQDGGVEPRWGARGRQLYYRTRRGDIMLADLGKADPRPTHAPQVMLRQRVRADLSASTYAVAPDGRLLVKKSVEEDGEILALFNWTTMLERP